MMSSLSVVSLDEGQETLEEIQTEEQNLLSACVPLTTHIIIIVIVIRHKAGYMWSH